MFKPNHAKTERETKDNIFTSDTDTVKGETRSNAMIEAKDKEKSVDTFFYVYLLDMCTNKINNNSLGPKLNQCIGVNSSKPRKHTVFWYK